MTWRTIWSYVKPCIGPTVTILTGVGVCINLGDKMIGVITVFREIPTCVVKIDTLEVKQGELTVNYIELKKLDSINTQRTLQNCADIKRLDTKGLLAKQP